MTSMGPGSRKRLRQNKRMNYPVRKGDLYHAAEFDQSALEYRQQTEQRKRKWAIKRQHR